MANKLPRAKRRGKHALIVLLSALMLLSCAALAIADVRVSQKKKQLAAQVSSLNQTIASLKASNQQIQQGIDQQGDPKYIEQAARQDLDMQKPGEQVVTFVQPQPAASANAPSQTGWQAWLGNAWNLVKSKL